MEPVLQRLPSRHEEVLRQQDCALGPLREQLRLEGDPQNGVQSEQGEGGGGCGDQKVRSHDTKGERAAPIPSAGRCVGRDCSFAVSFKRFNALFVVSHQSNGN